MFGYLLLALAAAVLFLSIWVVVPTPSMILIAFGVGVPELSPVLAGVAVLLTLLLAVVGRGHVRLVGCVTAAVAAALLALPLRQLSATVQRFDQAMTSAGVVDPAPGRGGKRRLPVSFLDMVVGINPGESQISRGVPVATVDGEPLTVDVYRGSRLTSTLAPVIVQIYGGGWQRGDPSDSSFFAEYFAARGYVVFAIDYRHAPRWRWPAQLNDVKTAFTWIAEHAIDYGADAKRVALVGRSAGGQLALMAASRLDVLPIAGVVNLYGPTNLREGWANPPNPDPLPARPTLEAYLGGTPDAVPQQYQDASPVAHVTSTFPPTLSLYGTRDHIVEARFGRELHARLRDAGATSVLLELPWSEHAFDVPPRGFGLQISLYYTERFLSWALSR